jgi:hypothetical protein
MIIPTSLLVQGVAEAHAPFPFSLLEELRLNARSTVVWTGVFIMLAWACLWFRPR